jgi:hypothetical protein
MIKFSLKLAAFLVLLLSSVAHAGLIEELAPDSGIMVCTTYDQVGGACIMEEEIPDVLIITKDKYQWVWASGVNTESYALNTLRAPDYFSQRKGWRYATEFDELAELATLTLADFTNGNETLHAALYWNTWLMSVSLDAFADNQIASAWVDGSVYDTFYLRDIPSEVPEPSTILIFAIALIVLSLRKRAIK